MNAPSHEQRRNETDRRRTKASASHQPDKRTSVGKFNADGSLTLYFQNESPGKDKEANWLPAPKGDFIPMIRMYWPSPTDPSVLDGSWTPPSIQKVGT